jgi:hypothetical protein
MALLTGLPPLRMLFFDDLRVGMTERLKKASRSLPAPAIRSICPSISPPARSSAGASRTAFTPQA